MSESTSKPARKRRPSKTAKVAKIAKEAGPAELPTATEPVARELYVFEMPVRWRDLDAFNHVNNATFLSYLEEARLVWLEALDGPWLSEQSAPVLAAATVNFRRPIGWPETLRIHLSCERLGRSSISIGHRICAAADDSIVYSDGHVVMVWVDAQSGKAAELPEAVRRAGS